MKEVNPPILYDKKLNLSVSFNAKSGCSFFVKWFFYQTNLYEKSESYHRFPHKYRTDIFMKNKNYNNFDIEKSNIITLVRNPFTRVVSSYSHCIKNGYINKDMSLFLKREITKYNTFTFYEFVKYLKTIDITNCDIHHKTQYREIDYKFILKVENLFEDFRNLENELNLLNSPLDKISNSLSFHKVIKNNDFKESCYNFDFYFKESNEDGKLFEYKDIIGIPDYKYFYNDELIEDILIIYKDDFELYKYDKTF